MRIAVSCCLILTALALPSLAEDLDPASVKYLAQTVGTWNIEESATNAQGQKIESAGPGTYRPLFDGRYVEHVSRAGGDGVEYYLLLTYDTRRKRHRGWFFSNRARSEWLGTWDEKTRTMTRSTTLGPGITGHGVDHFRDVGTMSTTVHFKKDGAVIFSLKRESKRLPDAKAIQVTRAKGPAAAPAELKSLAKLTGKWKTESVSKVAEWTPEEVKSKDEGEWFWILGGKYLLQKGKDAIFIYTYAAEQKAVKLWHFNKAGYIHEWAGNWNADGTELIMKSDLGGDGKVSGAMTQTFKDKDTVQWRAVASDKTGKVYHHIEGTSTRMK